MKLLSLRAGRLAVDLAPQAGGSVARFAIDESVDLLRPATKEALASGHGCDAAAFPLVPYSNRIANGRLAFDSETFHLEPNWPGVAHPMHGDGWARPWSVAARDERSAEIVLEHAPDGDRGGWPFRYRARQSYRLDDDRFTIRIAIENLEDREVPAGIGLHPFFVRDADTELAFRAGGVWLTDADVLSTEYVAVPPRWDFSGSRRVDTVVLDNCFDGWDGRATVSWPQRRLKLDIEASEPFRHGVVYIPPYAKIAGRPYFCVEPVSHANGEVAKSLLPAGATLAGEISFRPSQK
jgi:aldose 1-epimerase